MNREEVGGAAIGDPAFAGLTGYSGLRSCLNANPL
jgi:hypothetical protein